MARLPRLLFALGVALLAITLLMGIVLRNTAPSSHPEDILFMAKSNAALNRMMAAMKINPSHEIDKDFIEMMVPHHQGAIDMAQAELRYGHSEPLRGIAQEIIATQQQQIVAMQLDERGFPPSPGSSFHPALFDQQRIGSCSIGRLRTLLMQPTGGPP